MTSPLNTSFLAIALSRNVVLSALKVALVVGTLLALINYGDRLYSFHFTRVELLKITLTYLVPYGVSTWSTVQAIRSHPPQ